MKKILMVMLSLAILTGLSSCNKDKEEGTNSLVGTSWEGSVSAGPVASIYMLKFVTNDGGNLKIGVKVGEEVVVSEDSDLLYSFNEGTRTGTLSNLNGVSQLTFDVKGNKLTIHATAATIEIVLTKK
ncbi:MAG: hypothetical protein RR005_05655 [Mucinivorans sp.]